MSLIPHILGKGRFSYDQQRVSDSDIAHFCERQSHLILSYDQQEVSDIGHFCETQSHFIFSYDQQAVSDSAHFL